MNSATREDEDVSDETAHDDEWILPSEAVKRYGIGRRTVYTWIDSGVLPARIVIQGRRRHYQVNRAALEELVQVRVIDVPPAAAESQSDD